jgi:hypothetical protein
MPFLRARVKDPLPHVQPSSARQGKKRSMRQTRIIVTHYGGPDALRVVEEECPEPGDGEVRIGVLAAASPCLT